MGTDQISELGGKRDIYYQKDLSKFAKKNASKKEDKGSLWTMLHDRNKDGISDAYQKKSHAPRPHKAPNIITAKDRERLENQKERMLDKKERRHEREINQEARHDERVANKAEREARADARKLDRETYKRKLVLDEVALPRWVVNTVAGWLVMVVGLKTSNNPSNSVAKEKIAGAMAWGGFPFATVSPFFGPMEYQSFKNCPQYYIPIVPKLIKVPRDGSGVKPPNGK